MKYSVGQFVLVILLFIATSSCGLLIQDSVTFHGTQCSDSRVWMGGDIVVGGAFVYALSSTEGEVPAESYLPAAGLLLSAAAGYYKRENCKAHRGNASPEQWARDAEQARQRDAAQAQAVLNLGTAILSDAVQPSATSNHQNRRKKVYRHKAYFKCNGNVLFDESFTSYEACDAFRRQKEFYCSGIKIPIQC